MMVYVNQKDLVEDFHGHGGELFGYIAGII
jgi:hypothetical protein